MPIGVNAPDTGADNLNRSSLNHRTYKLALITRGYYSLVTGAFLIWLPQENCCMIGGPENTLTPGERFIQ